MSKRDITKQKILASAWELFGENGYDNTTTRQIARHASVADGTVFRHFETKLTILREGMLSQLEKIGQEVLATDQNKSTLDIGLSLIEHYYRYYFDNVELSRALLKEVIWDLDYYRTFDQALFQTVNVSTSISEKMPLIMDSYFMTLIKHLSQPEPSLEAALSELNNKIRVILTTNEIE
ncbi:transcriptional regulator [Vibrio lentus]|uniref:TetR/AcrR family transcriptional regulator n=1 Tax=Vibrio lentus TaxID=136468 RepID=UPI000C85B309|nr:TetR/AcrR family transcriptional regulator [Vibrio lentus]MCC4815599.1 TetR/AcrR family transcriptional regulator [Vibrio lentus]PMG70915.1 transcriptional regulator [Vibrio lentus]PMK89144.1 transcriptional regulator [Vibrio lentus]PML24110.1 transcriptional regulator [Vibrio lentus]PMM25088.1 transcriptional regulator [Vibrio lentus]